MNRDLHDTNSSAILTALTEDAARIGQRRTRHGADARHRRRRERALRRATGREHGRTRTPVPHRDGDSPARQVGTAARCRNSGRRRELPRRSHHPAAVRLLARPGRLDRATDAAARCTCVGVVARHTGLRFRHSTSSACSPSGGSPTRRPLHARPRRCAMRAHGHSPGDTDFAWTRITPWRTLLAAALDQPFDEIIGGEVVGRPQQRQR